MQRAHIHENEFCQSHAFGAYFVHDVWWQPLSAAASRTKLRWGTAFVCSRAFIKFCRCVPLKLPGWMRVRVFLFLLVIFSWMVHIFCVLHWIWRINAQKLVCIRYEVYISYTRLDTDNQSTGTSTSTTTTISWFKRLFKKHLWLSFCTLLLFPRENFPDADMFPCHTPWRWLIFQKPIENLHGFILLFIACIK